MGKPFVVLARRVSGQYGAPVVIALLLTGCGTTVMRSTSLQTAQQVASASAVVMSAYDALEGVALESGWNQGYLRVITSPQADSVDFTAVAAGDMSDLLIVRRRAVRQLQQASEQMRQLALAAAKPETLQAYAALVEALRGYSTDKTANTEFKKMAAALPADWSALWQSRRFLQTRRALLVAAGELADLWSTEQATWEQYIDDAYVNNYALGLLSLRLDSFDEKELAKQVSEPYGMAVKAGLFKLKKYYEALCAAAKIKAKLREAELAVGGLVEEAGTANMEKE